MAFISVAPQEVEELKVAAVSIVLLVWASKIQNPLSVVIINVYCKCLHYIHMKGEKLPTLLPETLVEQPGKGEEFILSESLIAVIASPLNEWHRDSAIDGCPLRMAESSGVHDRGMIEITSAFGDYCNVDQWYRDVQMKQHKID
ncbi:hypothetical protein EGR_01264 [Echinococcus granulosus]|uniref:Uncharacterized protein n=1 Tax=Echinococcus granulosus TaxID=6210 RepID=W6UU19_ECHGR|nr:hypothetical protein EGR_01264 [Echinococcus granulosus]EUB64136.1 hypothetical protein EGR_01264 [Echinococcus granulosus]